MQIMDPEKPDAPERLAQMRRALDELVRTGQIPEAVYFKGIVLLASRYGRAGDMTMAFALAQIPTTDYYRVTQVLQMEEDFQYQEAAVELANRFVESGMVSMDLEMPVTQRLAQA